MRYFLEFAFKGTNYHGWQYQPNASSVQETLNNALFTIFKKEIDLVGAGRTDAGVHAKQMFAHFDLEEPIDVDYYYINKITCIFFFSQRDILEVFNKRFSHK